MLNIDYTNYISIDKGNGILINKNDIETLEKYGFKVDNYPNLQALIFDLDNYLNETLDETNDLEESLIRISEFYYYNISNK